MENGVRPPLVTTVKERCRMCYTCVRECPAKAIRVVDAQASVLPERCIGCGNCIRICGQKAKTVARGVPIVESLWEQGLKVVAIVAPSFAAEFPDLSADQLVGALRAVGFSDVFEVSFGADLVAAEYNRILATTTARYLATTCPAIVSYIEKYHPNLVPYLMPVVSPMVASARVVRKKLGSEVRIAFLGPCIAKKDEAIQHQVAGDVDAVLTFAEVRELFALHADKVAKARPSPFTPPRGAHGGLFALSGGLLQAADLREDLLNSDILAVDGCPDFIGAIEEFEKADTGIRLLELLCCQGCVMGAGFSCTEPVLVRRRRVSEYVNEALARLSFAEHRGSLQTYRGVNLGRSFSADSQLVCEPSEEIIRGILASMAKVKPDDELNCGACGYPTCREHAIAIFRGLAEPEMCLPYTIEHLRETVRELKESHADLLRVKEALTHSEKLASMGQVAAGIAHELNNPLGIIMLYGNMSLEGMNPEDPAYKDLEIIVEQANRCKKIVNGLLNFARKNRVFRESIEVARLFQEAIRSSKVPEGVNVEVEVEPGVQAFVDKDQMIQVLCNLIDNGCAAMSGQGRLRLLARRERGGLVLRVEDSGTGIRSEHLSSIFDPFFSTKPVGKGTGLGLAVVHGIIKMHQGQIEVETNCDPQRGPTGTAMVITLPQDLAASA